MLLSAFIPVRVCQEFCSRWEGGCLPHCMLGVTPPPGPFPSGHTHLLDTPRTLPPRDGHCSGRCASYWNAFLFNISSLSITDVRANLIIGLTVILAFKSWTGHIPLPAFLAGVAGFFQNRAMGGTPLFITLPFVTAFIADSWKRVKTKEVAWKLPINEHNQK